MSSGRVHRRSNSRKRLAIAFPVLGLLFISAISMIDLPGQLSQSSENEQASPIRIMTGPENVTILLHLHYDGVLEADDETDMMNTDGPYNPLIFKYDYDDDREWGVTLKKNNSPNPSLKYRHIFIMEPIINSQIRIVGDATFTFWAGSRDNSTRLDLNLTLYDSNDTNLSIDDNVIATASMFQDPFLFAWNQYSMILSSIDYILPENHTLILELKRWDHNPDELYLFFDQAVLDSTLELTIARHFDIIEYSSEGLDEIPRTEFGGEEQIFIFANVSNALGINDTQRAELNIINLSDMQTILSTNMSIYELDQEPIPSWTLFRESIGNLSSGNYAVNVTALDNGNNAVWVNWTITIISIDHFVVSAPSYIQAGDLFNITIEAQDSDNIRLLNWSGNIDIEAIEFSTGTPISGLSNTSVFMSSSDDGLVVVNESFITAPLTIVIRASSDNATGDSAPIDVSPRELVSITLSPTEISLIAGGNIAVTAYGNDTFGNENDSWTPFWSLTPAIAAISGTGTTITITATTAGTAVLRCQYNATGIFAETNLTIDSSSLASIIVTPDSSYVWEGKSMNIIAEGYDSFGNPVNISSAIWSSEGFTMSQIIGTGSSGVFIAWMTPETGSVLVTLGGISGTADISVIPPPWGPSLGALPDLIGFEDTQLSPLDLSLYWNDINGTHNLSWFVTDVNNSLLIISGDYQARSVVNIMPQPDQSGSDTVRFWVRDPDGYTNFRDILITVLGVNDPPEFINDPPNQIYVKFDLPYVFDYDYYINDVDHDKSKLIMSASPSDYIEADGLSVTFTFPDLYDGESYFEIITLSVSDGSLSDSFTIKVWATTDTPPDLIEELPDVVINEGEMNVEIFDLDDYFIDVDGDMLYYTKGFKYVEIEIVVGTNVVLLSSPSEWSGQTNAVFIAHDPTGAIRTDMIIITVNPVNDPPEIIQIDPIQVRYEVEYKLDLRPIVTDPDDAFEELTITTSDPSRANYSLLPFPHLTIEFPANLSGGAYAGPYQVQILLSVTDNGGLNDWILFDVIVSDNNPPMVTVFPPNLELSFEEDSYLDKPESINLNALFIDGDGDELSYSFSGNDYINISIAPDGWVNFSSAKDWYGTEQVKFIGTDPSDGWASLTVRLDVISINDPPVLKQIPDIKHYSTRVWSISIAEYVYDVESDLSELEIVIRTPEFVKAVGLTLYFEFPENVSSSIVELYVIDGNGASSEIIQFKVEIKKTLAELIGYPWSFPVILLLAGILGYIIATRFPMPHNLEELFIIHNDGRLICHVGKEEQNGLDQDVVSAMFTAVQEFIRDSFREETGGLKMLEIGDKKVVIEKGRWIYGSLIYTGWPPKYLFKTFARFINDIEAKYGKSIESWDGRLKSLPGLKEMSHEMIMKEYITGRYESIDEQVPKKPSLSDQEVVDLLDSKI